MSIRVKIEALTGRFFDFDGSSSATGRIPLLESVGNKDILLLFSFSSAMLGLMRTESLAKSAIDCRSIRLLEVTAMDLRRWGMALVVDMPTWPRGIPIGPTFCFMSKVF